MSVEFFRQFSLRKKEMCEDIWLMIKYKATKKFRQYIKIN